MRCDIGNKMKSEQYHKYYMKVIDMNFKHCEAYCCMTYKCDKCNEEERIWNSRDGVTPFIIRCKCGGEMQHINFAKDERILNRVPEDEERVFSTMTYKDKKRMAKERAENLIKIGYKKPKDKNKLIKQLIREYNEEYKREMPVLITGKEYKRRKNIK